MSIRFLFLLNWYISFSTSSSSVGVSRLKFHACFSNAWMSTESNLKYRPQTQTIVVLAGQFHLGRTYHVPQNHFQSRYQRLKEPSSCGLRWRRTGRQGSSTHFVSRVRGSCLGAPGGPGTALVSSLSDSVRTGFGGPEVRIELVVFSPFSILRPSLWWTWRCRVGGRLCVLLDSSFLVGQEDQEAPVFY